MSVHQLVSEAIVMTGSEQEKELDGVVDEEEEAKESAD